MKYNDFVENLADDLQVEFQERERNIRVELIEVDKPWGKELGLSFDDGGNVRPILYPQKQYEYHEAGMNYFPMLYEMVDEIERALDAAPMEIDFNPKELKDTITIQLINTEVSKNYLLDKPHRKVEDLSMIYRLNKNLVDGANGSSVITNSMMELMGLNEKELYELAMEKAPINKSCIIQSMHETLKGLMSDEIDEIPQTPLIVVTNEEGCHGASTIMYPGILEECASIMKGDFYILPSSQHEVLLCSKNSDMSLYELKAMVREANDTVLDAVDFLSHSVYHYDAKEKVFEIADKYVERQNSQKKQSVIDVMNEKKNDVINRPHPRRNQEIGSRKVKGLSL